MARCRNNKAWPGGHDVRFVVQGSCNMCGHHMSPPKNKTQNNYIPSQKVFPCSPNRPANRSAFLQRKTSKTATMIPREERWAMESSPHPDPCGDTPGGNATDTSLADGEKSPAPSPNPPPSPSQIQPSELTSADPCGGLIFRHFVRN